MIASLNLATSSRSVNGVGNANQLAASNRSCNGSGGPLLSIGRVSAKLGLSQQTLRAAASRGELRCYVTSGQHRRFDLADCFKWLGHGQEEEKEKVEFPLQRSFV